MTEMSPFDDKKIPPPELTADQRNGVTMMRGMFLAYVAAGFTEEQAMELLKAQITAAVQA